MQAQHAPSLVGPPKIYKHDGWQGWGHWLGSSSLHTKQLLPFGEALAVARSLRLANRMG